MTEENVRYLQIGKEKHDIYKLSDEQKYRIKQLEFLQVRENELSAELDRVRRTKNTFQNDLFASLQTEEAAAS